ncbi:MAG: hypothetical protein ACYDGR_02565 [Candidatus Dormibacteria bacterium]
MSEWQRVEIYSTFLRIRGEIEILPGRRLSDEVNRLDAHLQMRNTVTDPLLSSYPVVSPTESNTTITKSSVVLIVPEGEIAEGNRTLWREKVRHHLVLNTTAFAMSADVHLEPRTNLREHLERYPNEFLPVTRVGAILVASISGGAPQTLQRSFALVNPASVVSFSARELT